MCASLSRNSVMIMVFEIMNLLLCNNDPGIFQMNVAYSAGLQRDDGMSTV